MFSLLVLTFLSFDLITTSPIVSDLSDNSYAVTIHLWSVRLPPSVSERHQHLRHLFPRLDELLQWGSPLSVASPPSQRHYETRQYGTFPTWRKEMVRQGERVNTGGETCSESYKRCYFIWNTTATCVFSTKVSLIYRIEGNFHMVQTFTVFADYPGTAKIKKR